MISREMSKNILSYFESDSAKGLILAGIFGSGKTTIINHCLDILKQKYQIYKFSGDDTVFRTQVLTNSKYFYEFIRGQTQNRVLVFIDEVQKCEEVFDAVKYLFDKGNASFIVSGSNPFFLQSTARKRLQRRADFKILYPLSLPEVLADSDIVEAQQMIIRVLKNLEIPESLPHIELNPKQKQIVRKYLLRGGLPLSFLSNTSEESLLEIQKTFDRGFEPVRNETHNFSDLVAVELAKLHSKEFAYTNIINKTRISKRQVINEVVQSLIGHGYVNCVTPFLVNNGEKTSYLKKYFFIDSGIVSYLTGYKDIERDLGAHIEGIVYSRLFYHLQFEITKNKGVYFFKNYTLKGDGSLRFGKGEVDAIYQKGEQIIPIEIKTTEEWTAIDTGPLEEFIKKNKLNMGMVLYGGPPLKKRNIVFWPYWCI